MNKKPTKAQLEALAFTKITGWKPRGVHSDTAHFVWEHTAVADVRSGRLYMVNENAPDVTGTKAWKLHAKLLAAGFEQHAPLGEPRKIKGRTLYYQRYNAYRACTEFAEYRLGRSYLHVHAIDDDGNRVGGFGEVLDLDAEIPTDIIEHNANKRAAFLAEYAAKYGAL
jgi:hypothetical protein